MGQRLDISVDSFDNGAILLFTPISERGQSWLADNVDDESPRHGPAVICECQFAPALRTAMATDGLVVA